MERERSQSYPDVQTQPLIETSSSLEFCTVLPTTLFPSTNLPFIPQPDGGIFGPFQQLLRAANSGVLSASNYGAVTLGANPNLPNGGYSHLRVDTVKENAPEVAWDDGYSAGTESENDTPRHVVSPDLFDEDNNNPPANDEYVASFSDPIGTEEFMHGRDFDYGDFATGIDDTDLNDLESENHIDSGSEEIDNGFNGKDLDQSLVDGHDPNDEFSTINEPDISACVLGDCGCSNLVSGQEISARYQEGVRMGFNKRQRFGTVGEPSDCRKPRNMGAVEIAMRTAEQRASKEVFEPNLGMVFDSYEEGYEFYNLYSWEYGFGIIYNRNSSRTNDRSYRTMQEFTCQKGGSDSRVTIGTKKDKCKARLKLLRDGDRWYVRDFVRDHNHPLSESCCEKREWKSHKRLDPYTLDVIRSLHMNNVTQTKIRCVVGSMFGSLQDAPCTKRSVRTICNKIARKKMDDDVSKTVQLFKQMKADDPDF